MKTTIENLKFPCKIKKKLKMKVSMGNLEAQFIDGHLIKFDKTNLSFQKLNFIHTFRKCEMLRGAQKIVRKPLFIKLSKFHGCFLISCCFFAYN